MTEKIKVNLLTTDLDPLGGYFAPAVPREGEHLVWDDDLYEVKTVTWEGLPELPEVQVRLER